MKNPWFKKVSCIYIPVSWQGILVTLLFLAFCVHIFIFVDGKSHSVSDTLYGIFPFIIPAFLLYVWAGSETSLK
jgi:hypothetical protein